MEEYYKEISLEDFGYREISEIATLLEKYSSGNHHDIIEYPIKIGFNMNSGYVFIIDDNQNTFMLNGEELEQYYNCGNCGKEGFKEEFSGKCAEHNCDQCKDFVPIGDKI